MNKYFLLMTKFLLSLGLVLEISGCASIQSLSLSSVQPTAGRRIWAEDFGNGYFGLTTPSLDVVAKLKSQCANGLSGIETQLMSRNFLVVQAYTVQASAWCHNK